MNPIEIENQLPRELVRTDVVAHNQDSGVSYTCNLLFAVFPNANAQSPLELRKENLRAHTRECPRQVGTGTVSCISLLVLSLWLCQHLWWWWWWVTVLSRYYVILDRNGSESTPIMNVYYPSATGPDTLSTPHPCLTPSIKARRPMALMRT